MRRQDPQQKLVDICFEIAMMIHDQRYSFKDMDREELAAWVARQLDGCGFPTTAVGISWGVLDKEKP